MKNWLYITCSIVILSLALFLRLYRIENRAPFDWDQNRDYLAVEQIARGNITLIGPVAKGEGGFFLGPLYYYLSVPGFVLSKGDPLSLPITSAILDALAIVAILVLFPKMWGRPQSIILALVWSFSWFAIEMSRISWNVALLQAWLVSFIYLLSSPLSSWKALLLGITLGLTWHIHAVIIPLSALISIMYLKKLKATWAHLTYIIIGYVIAISPLILFDIRHAGLEHNLILQFLSQNGSSRAATSEILVSTLSRFGKNTLSVISGQSNLSLLWGIISAILAGLALMRGTMIARIAGLIIVVNVLLVFYLGEIRFPEYYLSASYLPVLIILIDVIFHFKTIQKPVVLIAIGLFLYANLTSFTTEKTSFGLVQKRNLVQEIARHGNSFDLRYDLPFGRDSGIPSMLTRAGINSLSHAKNQIIITESTGESVFIDGEIARDLGWFGGLRLALRVVQ